VKEMCERSFEMTKGEIYVHLLPSALSTRIRTSFGLTTFSQFSDAWKEQIENRPSQILICLYPNHIKKTFGYIESLREIRWVSKSSLKSKIKSG
jgi:hypothetical protein